MGDTASRVTLRQLEIFLAVAREGTTLEAGHALACPSRRSAPALKSLQSNHGTVLFDRVGNRLALNHAGRRLESRARQLLDEARKLEAELLAAAPSGDLNISASFTIANHLLVDYLTPWLNRYPSARVDITPGNTPDVIERVLNRDSELGLIENEMTVPGVELIPWVQDELFAFCSPCHPLAARGRIQEADILRQHWILGAESGARSLFDEVFKAQLPKMSIRLELRHNEPILRAVEQQLGIGVSVEKVLAPHLSSGGLVALSMPRPLRLRRRFFFCLRSQSSHRPEVENSCASASSTSGIRKVSWLISAVRLTVPGSSGSFGWCCCQGTGAAPWSGEGSHNQQTDLMLLLVVQ